MNDIKYLANIGIIFTILGLALPFYLYTPEFGQLPLGMSFLADGIFLIFFSFIWWFVEKFERARREDFSETYIEEREVEL